MPRSAEEGKDWTRDRIVALNPAGILDVGPGAGTYADLLYPVLPDVVMDAVEIHEPYVARYRLRDKYHQVVVDDALRFLAEMVEFREVWDVVILGDVLEHLDHDRAIELWWHARAVARDAVFLSLPIYGYEQGECEGNAHEAHLHQWTDATVRAELDGIVDGHCWSIVGTYEAAGLWRSLNHDL